LQLVQGSFGIPELGGEVGEVLVLAADEAAQVVLRFQLSGIREEEHGMSGEAARRSLLLTAALVDQGRK